MAPLDVVGYGRMNIHVGVVTTASSENCEETITSIIFVGHWQFTIVHRDKSTSAAK